MIQIFLGLLIAEAIIIAFYFYKNSNLGDKVTDLTKLIVEKEKYLQESLVDFQREREAIRKDSKMRSGAVNWGFTIEKFVPFIDSFPIPPEDVMYLGQPIDYVGFTHTASKTKCTVHFIEVKSGNSNLMEKQKNIKKAIEDGRVLWHEVRVEGNTLKED